ncbi:MAG: DUF222 domain-containing protein, partial [Frankiaceae bacterium]|nr:DUF222 domain-containing protein [Frankiaceae bacterium]
MQGYPLEGHPAWQAAAEMKLAYQRTNARIGELEQMPAGPSLVAGLWELRSEPIDACGAVRVLAVWERVARCVEAWKMVSVQDAMYGAENLPGLTDLERVQLVSNDVAAIGAVHKVTAMNYVALVGQVARDLSQCWVALDRGELSLAHVRALGDVVENCPAWVAQAVDAQAVPIAVERGWTPGRLAAEADKIVMTIDPDGAAERAAAAREHNSDVRFRSLREEMATVTTTGDAVGMRDAMNVLDERAEELRRAGDVRRIGELRVAAFKEAMLGETPDVITETGEVLPAPEPTDPDADDADIDDLTDPAEVVDDDDADIDDLTDPVDDADDLTGADADGGVDVEPASDTDTDTETGSDAATDATDTGAADEPVPHATATPDGAPVRRSAPRKPRSTQRHQRSRQRRTGRRTRRRPARRDALLRMDTTTYLGIDDKPGWLDGYGPISAQTARALANDSAMRRMLTDPISGKPIDLGRTRYRPSQALRDAVVAFKPTCIMPSCDRPARNCQIDHRHERRDGGRTDLDNLDPLCVFHHNLKTKRLFKVDHNPDGSYTVRTALGFTFRRPPDPYPIETVQPPDDGHIAADAPEELLSADPDPPRPDDPLPDLPPLSPEDFLEYCDGFARALYEDA